MAKLQCKVIYILFHSSENGYTAMKATSPEYVQELTVVGIFPNVTVGNEFLCEGEWVEDKKYGRQFSCKSYEEVLPSTKEGVEKYLSSGMIDGIGPKIAKMIVKRFGDETIDILDNHIERLREIHGIAKVRFEKIRDSWNRHKDIKNIMIFLQSYGVSPAYAAKIFLQYGKDSMEIVKENPYRLADDISGIGFVIADGIAEKMGYRKDDPRRIQSGILYCMNQITLEGHVYALQEQAVSKSAKLLGVEEEPIQNALAALRKSYKLVQVDNALYLPYLHEAEFDVAEMLDDLSNIPYDDGLFNGEFDVEGLQAESGIQYDYVQLEAIREAIRSKVMVLTGGPGTGKTTTTKAIISAFRHAGLNVLLAAPTGRAAKRMAEATGWPAKTIHRLLEYNPAEGWGYNEDNPLDGDVLVVDECSMMDIQLMDKLLKAMPLHMRLVLVGDIDQLPSVGAGNVLRDIIESGCIPVVRLTKIFRQAQKSRIVMGSHAINRGVMPDISNGKDSDFFFIRAEDPGQMAGQIVNLVENRLPAAYDLEASQIQILTPMHKGPIGAENLNQALQEALNPFGPQLKRGSHVFREGDRVMQMKNNYDKDVYNGDLGYIDYVDDENMTLTVDFDGKDVEYETSDLEELSLAYATTIHKSQGSEYPVVIMPVSMNHYIMLQRNLIYTGVTRAKKLCILIGTTDALEYAIHNLSAQKRNTKLKERLQKKMFN